MNAVDFLIMWAGLFGFGSTLGVIWDDRRNARIRAHANRERMRARIARIKDAAGFYNIGPDLDRFAPPLDADAMIAAVDAATDAFVAGEEEHGQLEAGIKAYQAVLTVKLFEDIYA